MNLIKQNRYFVALILCGGFMFNKSLWSSFSDNWSTPDHIFDKLDQEFHFDLDVCADAFNHKCELYYDKELNGLDQDWSGHVCWCNPPYGRQIKHWIKKAYTESLNPGTVVVMLLPSRTGASYFHDYILPFAEIRFLRGRLYFGGSTQPAPFDSMVAVFRYDPGK